MASDPVRGVERRVLGPQAAQVPFEAHGPGRGLAAEELDHAAERVGPVQLRGSAAHDLDAVECGAGNPSPVDPAAEGVGERDTVGQDQAAAGAARTDAAQRHSLRRGIGDEAARAAEERESRNPAQVIVQRQGGRGLLVFAGEEEHRLRGARGRDLGARGGHGDRVREARGAQLHRYRLARSVGQLDLGQGEPRDEHLQARRKRPGKVQPELPGFVAALALDRTVGVDHVDPRVRDRAVRLVHDAAVAGRRFGRKGPRRHDERRPQEAGDFQKHASSTR